MQQHWLSLKKEISLGTVPDYCERNGRQTHDDAVDITS